jgi:type VI secretion system protein ImpB
MSSKEGSVAPEERINIRCETVIGNAKAERELPFKILMLGNYKGTADSEPLATRKTADINKDNFNSVLASHDLSLSLQVPDRLTDEPNATRTVNLRFNSLADFRPESIAQQVPEMRKSLEVREAIGALRGNMGIKKFREIIERVLKNPAERQELIRELGLTEKDLDAAN